MWSLLFCVSNLTPPPPKCFLLKRAAQSHELKLNTVAKGLHPNILDFISSEGLNIFFTHRNVIRDDVWAKCQTLKA